MLGYCTSYNRGLTIAQVYAMDEKHPSFRRYIICCRLMVNAMIPASWSTLMFTRSPLACWTVNNVTWWRSVDAEITTCRNLRQVSPLWRHLMVNIFALLTLREGNPLVTFNVPFLLEQTWLTGNSRPHGGHLTSSQYIGTEKSPRWLPLRHKEIRHD